MNEFRQDPVSGRWVILAADRDHRPNQFQTVASSKAVSVSPHAASDCPFCARQMDTPPIISSYGTSDTNEPWQVCVVPNLFPVLDCEPRGAVAPAPNGRWGATVALGRHEVVIESPTHLEFTSQLTQNQYVYMLQAYRDRMLAMRQIPGIQFALAIKNSGRDAGASLRHTHSQLFGLPLVPEQLQQELDGAQSYALRCQQCVFCDLIQAEIEANSRIVALTDEFVAWCPYASRLSYEIWLAPRTHHARFEHSDDRQLEGLGQMLQALVHKVDQHPRIDAFNYLLHSLPFDTNQQDHYHWHIEILPRTAKQAGFEWGTGIHINTMEPMQAASELREDVVIS